jgi:hypothetical protein
MALLRFLFHTLIALAICSATPFLRADTEDEDDLPLVGQPANFSGAIGYYEQPQVTAKPTELQVGNPLTFTVRITATAPVKRPPKWPNLREVPEFDQHFYIEDLPNSPRHRPEKQIWEFVYRLKPRSEETKVIPSLAFTYFHPDFLKPNHPARSKGYQTHYTDEIPLTVKPRDKVKPQDVQSNREPIRAPDAVYQLAEGSALLRRQDSGLLPVLLGVTLSLLIPPLLCMGGYVLWRRRHPDAARLARQRRSRAAQEALQALQALRKHPGSEPTRRIAAIVAAYLHERLDWPIAEPTPAEAVSCLKHAGFSAEPARKANQFFRTCDAARFAPTSPAGGDDLLAAAEDFILTLEAESWSG